MAGQDTDGYLDQECARGQVLHSGLLCFNIGLNQVNETGVPDGRKRKACGWRKEKHR